MKPILVCIVRDEIKTLPRLLDSVRDLAGGAVICDTGSEDGTYEWLTRGGTTFPFSVHVTRHDWVNFAHNRNAAFATARNLHGDDAWLCLADADWEWTGPQLSEEWWEILREGDNQGLVAKVTGHSERIIHTTFVRGPGWCWAGSVHESLLCLSDNPVGIVDMSDTWTWHHWADSGSRRYRDDVTMLRNELTVQVGNPRARFYLARTLFEQEKYAEAYSEFVTRSRMEGTWESERWYAQFQAARCLQLMGEYRSAIAAYLECIESDPLRPEPYYWLSSVFRHMGMHKRALRMCSEALAVAIHRDDQLFAEEWIFEYGIEFERCVSLWHVTNPERCKDGLRTLKAYGGDKIPGFLAEAIERNLAL